MLDLVSDDCHRAIGGLSYRCVSGQTLRIASAHEQSIRQRPDWRAEGSDPAAFLSHKHTSGHSPTAIYDTWKQLRKLRFDQLQIADADHRKDRPSKLHITTGDLQIITSIVEWRLHQKCKSHRSPKATTIRVA